jgi:mannose-6-phosphate isomerase-like protein (cupin superfamily)
MQKLGNIEILSSSCNLSTIKDGRGGIFTWIPEDKIEEFNLLYFKPGKVRGNHSHPEFVEYFLVVSGSGVIITRDPKNGEELVLHATQGTCIRTPKNTSHAFHAITETNCVSLLTKPWDNCETPIIHDDLVPFDDDYKKYAEEQGFKYSIEERKKKHKGK